MRIGVPKEIHKGEKRVATTPEVAALLKKIGFEITIESAAGSAAKFTNDAYRDVGVQVENDTQTLYRESDIILKVRPPNPTMNSPWMRLIYYEKDRPLSALSNLVKTKNF